MWRSIMVIKDLTVEIAFETRTKYRRVIGELESVSLKTKKYVIKGREKEGGKKKTWTIHASAVEYIKTVTT